MVSRNKLILVGLAGMFMLAQSLYAQKSGLTYTLAFKDYLGDPICDVLTVTAGANGLVTATDDNFDCLGDNTWADGINSLPVGKFDYPGPYPLPPFPKIPGEGIGSVSLADNAGVLLLGDAAATIYLDFKTSTWTTYVESTGYGAESWGNNGTFTIVEEGAATVGKTSLWKQHSAELVSLPFYNISGYPTGTYDILMYPTGSQVAYCDFFTLSTDGDLVGGVHNFTDGCGDLANAAAGGNYTFLGNGIINISNAQGNPMAVVGGRGLLTTDNAYEVLDGVDYTENYYFDFQSGFWSYYYTDGTTGLLLGNWGTFKVVLEDPLTAKTVTQAVGGPRSNSRH
jgi:hypothetical protein